VLRAAVLQNRSDDEESGTKVAGAAARCLCLAPVRFCSAEGDPPIVCTWSSKAPFKSSFEERGSLTSGASSRPTALRRTGSARRRWDAQPQAVRAHVATVLLGVSKEAVSGKRSPPPQGFAVGSIKSAASSYV